MPKKNKVLLADGSEAEPENVVMGAAGFEVKEEVKEPETDATSCGHVNKQHYGASGRLEDITCDLLPGHDGDHHARYMKNIPAPVTDARGIVIEQHYQQVEADTYWSNAAGIPARDVKEGKMLQLSQYQKDLLAEIMKKDPENITVEMALEQAKASPTWLAGNA